MKISQVAVRIWMIAALLMVAASIPAMAQTTLVVNLDHVSEDVQAMIVRDFEAAHPGVKVEVVPKGDQNIARIVAGQQLDVWQMDIGSGYVDLIRQGLLVPLDPYLERYPEVIEGWAQPILDTQIQDGKTYLLPRGDVGMYLIWTNRTMFEEAGLAHPSFEWTHDDFVDYARRIRLDKDGDGIFDQWLYSMDSFYAWIPWFANRGGHITDPSDPAKLAIGSAESVNALQWMQSLVEDGIIPSKAQLSNARSNFHNGKLATAQGEARKVVPTALEREWDTGVTLEPTGPAGQSLMLTWQGFSISSTSKDPDLAWEFIRHVVQPKYQLHYISELFSPTVNTNLNQEYFGADVPIPGFLEAYMTAFQRNLVLAVPKVPWEVFDGFDKQVMTHVINGTRPASQAVAESIDALQAMLTDYYAQ